MTVHNATAEELEEAARRRDEATSWKVFVGVGVFIAVLAVVYWFSSYERAGTTMLALASALALFFGSFLYGQERRRLAAVSAPTALTPTRARSGAAAMAPDVVDSEVEDEVDQGHYLPDASVWPLAMGVGAALTLNGLIISWPYATPGAALLVLAVGGFVAQGRRRG